MADVKYIPKLRFPEFKNDGEWKDVKLGEVCAVNRGVRVTRNDLNNNWPYPVFQNTDSPLGFYNKFNVKANNPFVIIGGSAGLIGFCNTNFWAADDCVSFGDNNSLDKYFLYLTLLFHSIEIKNNIRGGNIPRIDRKSLEQLKVSVPTLPEQQKIAAFLTSLDEQISAHTKKLEALKAHKKGLMQQLFPANGEKTPKLRFPEFKNDGEWEEVRLGDVTKERNEINKTELALLSIGQDGVYPQSESTKRDVSNKDKTKYKHICPNDIGYNTMRMWQGRSAISYLEGIVSPAYTIVIPQANIVPLFLAIVLKLPETVNEFFKHSQGLVSDTLNCKYKDFVQVQICIPSLPEQQKIASFLSSIDEMIQAQDDKIQKLKTYKNGLMQQMFAVETPYYDVSTDDGKLTMTTYYDVSTDDGKLTMTPYYDVSTDDDKKNGNDIL